ncbi:MAG TPA: hypothetical protein VN903_30915 [Polyangia bacterium]|nr:hypothetical protein [Polyangia bacterium]
MKIALGGMFRNSTRYLERYFRQVNDLADALGRRQHRLRLVLAEGDSTDTTWVELAQRTRIFDAVLVKRDHGLRHWGSEDVPDRWRALSWVCNGILDHVTADIDALVYVETDLIWTPDTMLALLAHLEQVPAVAPMCFAGEAFYDIWGHIKGGINFGPFPPYHDDLLPPPALTQVDSAGSCLVLRGEVARCVRYGPDDLVRGLGRSIYQQGYSLWVDPALRVDHPL